MESFSKTTWLSIQKVRHKRQRAERLRYLFEKIIVISILALAVFGLIAIIFFISGYKFTSSAEAAAPVIEQIKKTIPVIEEKKPEAKKEEAPKITDSEIIKTLKAVCNANGMDDQKNNEVCWQTLWAMSYQESKLGYLMTGDQGRSKGYFHIQTKLHNVTEECAKDLNCSADWTLKRMITKGFPVYWTYSVQAHNGFGTEAAKQGEYAKIIASEIAMIKK